MAMNTTAIFVFVFCSLNPVYIDIADLAKRPTLPFEATTFEHDDLVAFIEGTYKYDGFAEEDIGDITFSEACDRLMNDETAPFALRAWVVRRMLYAYSNRLEQTLAIGRAWLQEHEERDPNPIEIRYMMARSVARTGFSQGPPVGESLRNLPEFEGVRALFDDFFSHHPPDNMYVAHAHLDYAHILKRYALRNGEYHTKVTEHLGEALAIMEWVLENRENTNQEQKYLESMIAKYRQEYEERLSEGPSAQPVYTEEQYRDNERASAQLFAASLEEQKRDPEDYFKQMSFYLDENSSPESSHKKNDEKAFTVTSPGETPPTPVAALVDSDEAAAPAAPSRVRFLLLGAAAVALVMLLLFVIRRRKAPAPNGSE